MEEKKEVKKTDVEITDKPNTVKMQPEAKPQTQVPANVMEEFDSMSKNQLKEVAGQLYYQNQQLMNRVKNMDMTNIFRRFDYLFKVMETPKEFPEEFVKKVVEEICTGMYPEEINGE